MEQEGRAVANSKKKREEELREQEGKAVASSKKKRDSGRVEETRVQSSCLD